jgi:hypothetical protein
VIQSDKINQQDSNQQKRTPVEVLFFEYFIDAFIASKSGVPCFLPEYG